jgi:hypothetical protein
MAPLGHDSRQLFQKKRVAVGFAQDVRGEVVRFWGVAESLLHYPQTRRAGQARQRNLGGIRLGHPLWLITLPVGRQQQDCSACHMLYQRGQKLFRRGIDPV